LVCCRDLSGPPGTLGYGWRQVDVVELSAHQFTRDSTLLRAFERVDELPERECCFDDDTKAQADRFRIKVKWAAFPSGDSPRYTRRVSQKPTAENPTPNDVIDPPYLTKVQQCSTGYTPSSLGWEYKDVTKPIPTFGEPLPPNGRLGAKVDEAIVPEGLRKLLVHSEAERAKRSHGQPPLNYAVYNESAGSWEGGRFVPGKVSQAKLINRGGPARAAAANYESVDQPRWACTRCSSELRVVGLDSFCFFLRISKLLH
jgi:hypothetical protein